MSLCLALSEDDDDGGFCSWNIYPVPEPMLGSLCRFPINYHTSSEVDAIMILVFLQRRKLRCKRGQAYPRSQLVEMEAEGESRPS